MLHSLIVPAAVPIYNTMAHGNIILLFIIYGTIIFVFIVKLPFCILIFLLLS